MRVYVAGPYSDDNVMSVLHNIRAGIRASYDILLMGHSPFCPWLDYQFVLFDDDKKLSVKDFYKYSIDWLVVSDIIYILDGWEKSKGALREIEIAKIKNIPVFYEFNELRRFLKK